MKKIICLTLLFLITSTSIFSQIFNPQDINIIENIDISKEIKDAKKLKKLNKNTTDFLSKKDALNDAKYILYLFETSYSGYDEMQKNGFSKNAFFKFIEDNFINTKKISKDDFVSILADYFKNYINDFHFFINSENIYQNVSTDYYIYFSNTFVKKIKNEYLVVASTDSGVNLGDKYLDDEKYLFLYPSFDDDTFRIGIIKDYNSSNILPIKFNEKIINLYLYKNASNYRNYSILDYTEIESKNSAYIYIPSFKIAETEEQAEIYKIFENAGNKYRNKKNIIIDLRNNAGGSSYYYSVFLANLLFEKNIEEINFDSASIKTLCSQEIISFYNEYNNTIINKTINNYLNDYINYYFTNFNGHKIIYTESKNSLVENFPEYKFNGKIIILSGKQTASSGESAISQTDILYKNNYITIGENTAGCISYSDIITYVLPVSGIEINLGSAKTQYYGSEIKEGIGFLPDYWSSKDSLLETIFYVTQDSELDKKLSETKFFF